MNLILYRMLERKKRVTPQQRNTTRKVNQVGREVDTKNKCTKLASKEICYGTQDRFYACESK